jgi:hypothetical protein
MTCYKHSSLFADSGSGGNTIDTSSQCYKKLSLLPMQLMNKLERLPLGNIPSLAFQVLPYSVSLWTCLQILD